MEPYQKAAQELRRQGETPITTVKQGATLLGGGFALNKILPFLNQYIPENLAIKGMSKLNNKLGKFLNTAMESQYDFDEIKEFLGDKVKNAEQKQEPAKEYRNIIEQYSPELFQFMEQEIKKGRKPIEAGAIAQNSKKFTKAIESMQKDHNTSWSDIIQSIFGGSQEAPPQQQMQQPQQMQGQQQGGQGQQALMSILQRINQRMGGR